MKLGRGQRAARGLGLSIVKTLVEGMNGTLKVHSKLGKGSLFTVILPISPKLSPK